MSGDLPPYNEKWLKEREENNKSEKWKTESERKEHIECK